MTGLAAIGEYCYTSSKPKYLPVPGLEFVYARAGKHVLRLALLQVNPTAGDLDGNAALIMGAARSAKASNADLMVTPELALMGYLPRDLLMNQGELGGDH